MKIVVLCHFWVANPGFKSAINTVKEKVSSNLLASLFTFIALATRLGIGLLAIVSV